MDRLLDGVVDSGVSGAHTCTSPQKPIRMHRPKVFFQAGHCSSSRVAAGINNQVPCQNRVMDIERINQIGTLLADLTARTGALRGYL
jgi:hypothetical protein